MRIKLWVFKSVLWFSRMALAPFFKMKTEGTENLPNESAFILLPKHQRWEDIPLIGLATPRHLYYVAKHELFKNPLSDWLLRSLGGIPINRVRPLESRKSFRAVLDLLGDGEGVVIFPEGTYYKNRMGRGKVGMMKLVMSRMTLPFVPVGIQYRRSGLRTDVKIRFGNVSYAGTELPADQFLYQMLQEIAGLSGISEARRDPDP